MTGATGTGPFDYHERRDLQGAIVQALEDLGTLAAERDRLAAQVAELGQEIASLTAERDRLAAEALHFRAALDRRA